MSNVSNIKATRAADAARQRQPPEPPSRPIPIARAPSVESPRSLDEAESDIMLAEARALEEKARLRDQWSQATESRTVSNAEHAPRSLRGVPVAQSWEEPWRHHLSEPRWGQDRNTASGPAFDDTMHRRTAREASIMHSRLTPGPYQTAGRSDYPESTHSSIGARQSSELTRVAPGRELPGDMMMGRPSFALSTTGGELHPTLSRQSAQTQGSVSRSHQRTYEHLTSGPPSAPSLNHKGSRQDLLNRKESRQDLLNRKESRQNLLSHKESRQSLREGGPHLEGAKADTSKVTLACLLLAHLLHNTGGESQSDPSSNTFPHSEPADRDGIDHFMKPPSVHSERHYSWYDMEALSEEDRSMPSSPTQRHNIMRHHRPGGPREPRRPSDIRSSFASSISPSDSASCVLGLNREDSRRAATPPTPTLDDVPEGHLHAAAALALAFDPFDATRRPSLATLPGYSTHLDTSQERAPTPPVIPSSPPPQYSPSIASVYPPFDPSRVRKPETAYHNPRPIRANESRPSDDCAVQ